MPPGRKAGAVFGPSPDDVAVGAEMLRAAGREWWLSGDGCDWWLPDEPPEGCGLVRLVEWVIACVCQERAARNADLAAALSVASGLADRVAGQSDLLSRRAEKPAPATS